MKYNKLNFILCIVIMFMPVKTNANLQPPLNGRISAVIVTGHSPSDMLRKELSARIWEAERLLNETYISASGTGIPPKNYWATEKTFNSFTEKINYAYSALNSINNLTIGDEFNIVLRIDDNTGFAGMMLRLYVPQELELIGIKNIMGSDYIGFHASVEWDGVYTVNPPINGHVVAGWAGRTTDIPYVGDLISYTFRVNENFDGQTASITLAFANIKNYETPTCSNNNPLLISLPGNKTGFGVVVEIANITA